MPFNRQPKPLSDYIKTQFAPANMGTGFKRGLVLLVAPAKIKEVLDTHLFRSHLKNIKLQGQHDRPNLVIQFAPGSPWRIQLHMHRHQLKQKINERVESEFIKDVRVY